MYDMRTRATHLVMLAMLAAALLAGCQSAPPAAKPSPAPSPAGPREGYQRPRNPYFLPRPILAMEPQGMRQLATTGGGDLRWYDGRNDAQLSVRSGYQSSTFESVYTTTYDHQYQHGGQVRDHYSQWTRKGSVKEAVR